LISIFRRLVCCTAALVAAGTLCPAFAVNPHLAVGAEWDAAVLPVVHRLSGNLNGLASLVDAAEVPYHHIISHGE